MTYGPVSVCLPLSHVFLAGRQPKGLVVAVEQQVTSSVTVNIIVTLIYIVFIHTVVILPSLLLFFDLAFDELDTVLPPPSEVRLMRPHDGRDYTRTIQIPKQTKVLSKIT